MVKFNSAAQTPPTTKEPLPENQSDLCESRMSRFFLFSVPLCHCVRKHSSDQRLSGRHRYQPLIQALTSGSTTAADIRIDLNSDNVTDICANLCHLWIQDTPIRTVSSCKTCHRSYISSSRHLHLLLNRKAQILRLRTIGHHHQHT